MSAKNFGLMTLGELCDAIIGHNEEERERLQWQLWGVRKQIIWAIRCAGDNDFKEEEVFPLEMDEEIKRARIEGMTPIKVTIDGAGE